MKNQNTAKSLKALSNKLDKEEQLLSDKEDVVEKPILEHICLPLFINSVLIENLLSFELTTSVTGISAELTLNGPKLNYTLSSMELTIAYSSELIANYKATLRTVKVKAFENGTIHTVLYFTDMEKK